MLVFYVLKLKATPPLGDPGHSESQVLHQEDLRPHLHGEGVNGLFWSRKLALTAVEPGTAHGAVDLLR